MSKYVIRKGKHSHSNLWARLNFLFFGKTLKYNVRFDRNCWYVKLNTDSEDLNKLFGFGGADHHKNSIRLCWKPDFKDKGTIKIYVYWYDDQSRASIWFVDMRVDEWVEFQIRKTSKGFVVHCPFRTVELGHTKPNPTWKKLYPYFGGDNTAPHTMTIELK